MSQVEIDKRTMRQIMRERRQQFPITEKLTAENQICHLLDTFLSEKQFVTIAGFYPLSEEVNISPILRNYANKLALPCITPGNVLEFRRVDDWENLVPNQYSIPEPIHGQLVELNSSDVIIVPGLAFDKAGNRLGRGKGYYDRFLKKLPQDVLRLGVSFSYQIHDILPLHSHDQKIHSLLTEKGLLHFS